MASSSVQREVRDRVLTLARNADPQCKQQKVATTEIVEVHPDGRSAEELWTVQQCGARLNYIVTFPLRRGASFSARQER